MKILFIGNSHTYYNSMPDTVRKLLEATGQKTHVTMLTAGGKNLVYHTSVPDVSFNIRCGNYDAVIVQDCASNFDASLFREGAKALKDMVDKSGAKFFLYMPWALRDRRESQQRPMTDAYHAFCRANKCLFAPCGEVFSKILMNEPLDALYREDGNHATPLGSYLAAVTIFYTVTGRKRVLDVTAFQDPGVAAGFPVELCKKIHTEACHVTRLYNG